MSHYAYVHVRPGADVTGVFYVGKGKGRRAWDFHKRNPHHSRVIKKHGAANIDVAVVGCSDEATAFELEIGLIRCLKRAGVKLTNMSSGGEGVAGFRHSPEARANMSEARKGRKHSDETKRKMSEVRKVKNAFKGRAHSDETKAKISATKKANPTMYWLGKKRDPEVGRKIADALRGRTGRKHSDEVRAKMSAVQRGRKCRPFSEEHRANLSAAVKEVWRKRKQSVNGDVQ